MRYYAGRIGLYADGETVICPVYVSFRRGYLISHCGATAASIAFHTVERNRPPRTNTRPVFGLHRRRNHAKRTATTRRCVRGVRTGSDTPKPFGAFLCALLRFLLRSFTYGHLNAPLFQFFEMPTFLRRVRAFRQSGQHGNARAALPRLEHCAPFGA